MQSWCERHSELGYDFRNRLPIRGDPVQILGPHRGKQTAEALPLELGRQSGQNQSGYREEKD